jgi:hypothetical protein
VLDFAQPFAALLVLLGFSFAVHRLLKSTFEISIFLAISSIVCVLYVAALYDVLQMVAASLIYIGLGLFAIYTSLWVSQKGRANIFQYSFTPFLCYVGLVVFLWLRLSSQKFILWDDFSHWGLATRDLYFTNALPKFDSVVTFLDYPPGGSLFNYLVLSIPDAMGWQHQKTFNEGVGLFAQSIVVISALFPLIGYALRKKGIKIGLIILGIVILSLFGLGYTPVTLMIDLAVAAFFGGALVVYITSGRKLVSVAYLIPAVMCLVILKSVGLFLSYLIIFLVANDQCYQIIKCHKVNFHDANYWKGLIISILVLACLPLVALNTNLSWKNHAKEVGAKITFKTQITTSDIGRIFAGPASEKESKVKGNFVNQLVPLRIEYPPGVTLVKLQNTTIIFLLLLVLSILVYRQNAYVNRSQNGLTMIILVCGFVVYCFGLLLLYLFSFTEYEAVRLASFDRYLGIYQFGWLLGLLVLLLLNNGRQFKILLIILGLTLVLGGDRALYFFRGSPYDYIPKFNTSIEQLLNKAEVDRSPKTRIYFISQCDSGFDYVIFKSLAYPAQISPYSFSIGQPCGPDDVWTTNLSIGQWRAQLLSDYSFVVVAKSNEAFWDKFGALFNVEKMADPSIFRVDSKNGKLVYIPVN